MTQRTRTAMLAIAGLLFISACKETASPEGEFVVAPAQAELLIGDHLQLTAVGAPSTPAWSSSNSSVATVISETGYVTGLSRGMATISAVAEGSVASADVTVLLPPSLDISQPTVDFFMDVGGDNPPLQAVQVNNGGDRTLEDVTVQGITYGPNHPRDWLSVSASSGTAPLTLTLSANGLDLPRGTYTATVQVASPNAGNSPQNLAVMLHVQADAAIAVSRTVVPMASIPGVVIQESVDVTNAGDKTLDGLAVDVQYIQGQTGWLTATLDGTQAPTALRLTGSTQNLGVGNYSAIAHITSTVPGVASKNVSVNLTVSPGPAISLASTAVTFQANTGQNPANQSVAISNGGGGTLSDLSLGTITYGGGQPAGWLTATLAGTTAPTSITLGVTSAALAEGSYTATVPVQSPVASNSPINLVINLNVGPPPVINLNPTALQFDGWSGSGALAPGIQAIQITNGAGSGPLTGLSYSVSYGVGASNWLNFVWQGNKMDAPTTLLVQPSVSSLPAGIYSATITFSSSMSGVASKTLNVTYVMHAFSVEINPSLGACTGCHGGGQPPTIGANSSSNCAALSGYATPGDGFNSIVYRKLSGATSHSGGTFPSLANIIRSWIDRGAPCG